MEQYTGPHNPIIVAYQDQLYACSTCGIVMFRGDTDKLPCPPWGAAVSKQCSSNFVALEVVRNLRLVVRTLRDAKREIAEKDLNGAMRDIALCIDELQELNSKISQDGYTGSEGPAK